jgi:hypothetical protein
MRAVTPLTKDQESLIIEALLNGSGLVRHMEGEDGISQLSIMFPLVGVIVNQPNEYGWRIRDEYLNSLI